MEKERVQELHDRQFFNYLNQHDVDRITELTALVCDVPVSLISFIDEKRQWIKSKMGTDITEVPIDSLFGQYTVMDTVLFEVQDATTDDRFKETPFVTGDPHICFYAGYPLINSEGNVLGTLCVIDYKPKSLSPNQKRGLVLLAQETISLIAEETQKEKLQNFERLYQLSIDAIGIAGMNGCFKKVNPAFERLLGYSAKFLTSTPLLDMIHPDDVESTLNEVKKLTEGVNTISFINRYKTSSDEYKTIHWTASAEPASGNIFCIGREITLDKIREEELVLSEKNLRAFFDNSHGLMCTHDLHGKFISVNNAGALLLGYTREEISKLSLFDIVPAVHHPLLTAYLSEIISKGRSKGQMATRHKNGSLLIWMFSNVLERNNDGSGYIIGNAIDITEKHELEKDLKRTREILEQTNKVAKVGGWENDLIKNESLWTKTVYDIFDIDYDFNRQSEETLELFKASSKDALVQAVENAVVNGTKWDLELQLKKHDKWVRSVGEPVYGPDNQIIKLRGVFIDSSTYKLAELALKKSIETQEKLNYTLLEKIDIVKQQDRTIEKIKEFKF
ncbi:MAG TPA: PAS domain S-box protein [Sphingobacteriaceae bacterium]|nr:PAS domain S-box protein [Sphingobacteriaceae bacterium]